MDSVELCGKKKSEMKQSKGSETISEEYLSGR
jgi:hypothetical protein